MRFSILAEALDAVANTRRRSEKISIVSKMLKRVEKDEIQSVTNFLAGSVFGESEEKTLKVSWKGLMRVLKETYGFSDREISEEYDGDAGEAIASLLSSNEHSRQTVLFSDDLTVSRVSQTFEKLAGLSGRGSAKERTALLTNLFADAEPREARYLVALVLNDMRTGLSEGLLAMAIAEAFDIDEKIVRRAWSFTGNLGEVAWIAVKEGERGLQAVSVEYLRPVKPMLATPIDSINDLFEKDESYSFELKLDGARVQIHKVGDQVRIFSRRLRDVTEGLPDIVDLVKKVIAQDAILDGEVLAVDESGKPFPFQVVMRRFGRTKNIESAHEETALALFVFDILKIKNNTLVDLDYEERWRKIQSVVPQQYRVKRVVTDDLKEARAFFEESKEQGHEGLVAKKLSSSYMPGKRGKLWFKIKHTLETLDLVIIGAEWGHGRRSKWLSDYHLAVYDEELGEFTMVGKTFKGLTDTEFKDMTSRLQEIETFRRPGYIKVKPEIVVEVLASEIQDSPTYKSGMALRFARIKDIRLDKSARDATTLAQLEEMYEEQFKYKAR